ncbi:unnamed protein product [Cuscuta campestris]|uniref:Calcium-transporting ATPase n=1 Tax=Cuscuta campestris TaxID=132261 RepID=A0A484NM54_9ASTE|nr:unnamed protein product [Cuscuta campestris]
MASNGGNHRDLEAGIPQRSRSDGGAGGDPFDIESIKRAPAEALKRWRKVALVLNASRRFRYTLDLKKEEQRLKLLTKIRSQSDIPPDTIPLALTPLSSRQELAGEELAGHEIPTVTTKLEVAVLARMQSSQLALSILHQHGGVEGVAKQLNSNLEKGINDDQVDGQKDRYGPNTYPEKKGPGFWTFVRDACRDRTLVILMVAAAASLALGIKSEGLKEGWYDGGSIAIAVIIIILVTAVSDYKQSLQFQSLNKEKKNIKTQVIRNGQRVSISIFEIVVGDVVHLGIGDQVPADGILISGQSLKLDESSMTGESNLINKDSEHPFLLSGCKVAEGFGTMLVTNVGMDTEWGKLMASISEDNVEETPLQVRLNGVTTFIGIIGVGIAILVLVVLMIRFFTGNSKNPDGTVQFKAGKTRVGAAVDGAIKIFTVAVTIVVVAVPEGLPLAVTLTLAYSMKKMMADKALVRRLSACETMGSATTICSDKTGTLTLNEMTVVEAHFCGKKVDVAQAESQMQLSEDVKLVLLEGILLNTTGSVFLPKDGKGAEISGSATEKAILQFGVKLGMNSDDVESKPPIIRAFPFNSEKKRSGVVVKRDSKVRTHWKGAAEIVLSRCNRCIDANNKVVDVTEKELNLFNDDITKMAERSLRCVAIAYNSYDDVGKVPTSEEDVSKNLILLAILGLKDPCRPGVKDAVDLCKKAGIKVRMVTGDNLKTARAIATECGILDSDRASERDLVIEGETFRRLSVPEQEKTADDISVMARSSPNDKLLLVQALRKKGHIVAVTGDGTNDAPALHEADIGLAMGIQGTEVAKESSDIIILDDNFASVVKVVQWGRSVYANIQKFIQFQLTVNVAALVINVVAAISGGDVPLNAVQLLWVNLIMDTLGALALATEPPTDQLMYRPPVGRREPLITNIMWRNLIIQAIYQVTILLALNFGGKRILSLEHYRSGDAIKLRNTLIFNSFVFCQVFNEFNARKPEEINIFKGVLTNRLFVTIVTLTVVFQVLMITFLGKFTSTVRLNWKLWFVSVAIGFISWPLAVIGKLIPVPETPLSEIVRIIFRWGKRREGVNKSNHITETS